MHNTYEIRLSFSNQSHLYKEIIQCILNQHGISPLEIVELTDDKKTRVSFFVSSSKKSKIITDKLRGIKLKNIRISCVHLKKSDWLTKWKADFQPFNITKDIRIIPSWLEKTSQNTKKKKIIINTDNVFGSGLHATTRLMAGFIFQRKGLFNNFFDIGTGTGILSIIAKKYGAETVWAIDKEKEALETATNNFSKNKVSMDFAAAIDLKNFKRKNQFDLVSANLLSNILINMRDKIVSYVKPGGYLAVSGIEKGNYRSFREKFKQKGLKCARIRKRDAWVAILYKRYA